MIDGSRKAAQLQCFSYLNHGRRGSCTIGSGTTLTTSTKIRSGQGTHGAHATRPCYVHEVAAELTRRELRGRTKRFPWRAVTGAGRALFYIVMTGLIVIAVFVLFASLADASKALVWGTYSETSREYHLRGGWHSTGDWQSDDGSMTLTDVTLSGDVRENGTVRAAYRPGATLGSDVVYTEVWSGAGVWVSLLMLAVLLFTLARQAFEWGNVPRCRRMTRGPVSMST